MKSNSYSHSFAREPLSKRQVVFFLIMEVGPSALDFQSFSLAVWVVQVVCSLHRGSRIPSFQEN